jgi:hypothetical protein
MSRTSWIEEMCRILRPIEQETIDVLGEQTAVFFVNAANDCVTINAAIGKAYPGSKSCNLVTVALYGLFKEASWFQFLFLAGNYPLLLGRLRFAWESVFRAYLVEHYPMGPCKKWGVPGPAPEDKVAWLDEHDKNLNWDICIEPVLRAILPLADQHELVRNDVKEWFNHLHRYAHPSAYLLDQTMNESALHVRDGFDENLAKQAMDMGARVFDLIWMVVFAQYPLAFNQLDGLEGAYPIVSDVMRRSRLPKPI